MKHQFKFCDNTGGFKLWICQYTYSREQAWIRSGLAQCHAKKNFSYHHSAFSLIWGSYSGDQIPAGSRFSAPFHPDPGTHPASYTTGTGSVSLGKAAGTWYWPPIPSSVEVKERVELHHNITSGNSWPVLWWTLPFTSTGNFEFGLLDVLRNEISLWLTMTHCYEGVYIIYAQNKLIFRR